jgi:hypothetical protein
MSMAAGYSGAQHHGDLQDGDSDVTPTATSPASPTAAPPARLTKSGMTGYLIL